MLYFKFENNNSDSDQAEVQDAFFTKLKNDLQISRYGWGDVLYEVIDVPSNAFSIDEDAIGKNCDELIKFVIKSYTQLPIDKFGYKSLEELGFSIGFIKKIEYNKLKLIFERCVSEDNSEMLEEELLYKNMSDDEKVKTFSENLENIQTEDNELIIVDPYLFATVNDTYCNLLAKIINTSKARSCVVVTDKKNYIVDCFKKVEGKITPISLSVHYSCDYHDRFWIAGRKKGFNTGTSFNGIGKKFSLINSIDDDDVKSIVDELSKIIE